MDQRYSGVTCRTLSGSERRIAVTEQETPLVIEPCESSSDSFLREFLSSHSAQLLQDLARHGAVLLRGFEAPSLSQFEQRILSIRGMCGMNEILLSEPGRTIVPGTRYVLYTNEFVKTGGTLRLCIFHTENYFVPDVPRYVSFLCQIPSMLGGETGLLNTAKLFADLPGPLQDKLEARTRLANLYSVTDVAHRYGVPIGLVHELCADAGLPRVSLHGTEYLMIYKPSVVQHPMTRERALLINYGAIRGIQVPLLQAFLPDYRGLQWLVHRISWKAPWLAELRRPHALVRNTTQRLRARFNRTPLAESVPAPGPELRFVSRIFTSEDLQVLAAAMRRRYSSFRWKRGDILIIDNLKIAHSGMAGFGKRELKAMICNPVRFPSSDHSPGLYAAPASDACECLGERLVRLREERTSDRA